MVMQNVKNRLVDYRRRREKAGERPGRDIVVEQTQPRGDCTSRLDSGDANGSFSRQPQTPAQQRTGLGGGATRSLYVTLLKGLLWILLWFFFVEVGFGAIYFIVSLLFFIVVSLRGSRRRPGEPSAYSVFNKGCEAIDGTLSAEQFERELRYGPLSIK